jgi:acetylornithine/N-succinyldiaminopimelate aminotransferase
VTEYLMNTYQRLPLTFACGEGAWLWDLQGNKYLDALCGVAVTNIGHAHPRLTAAIAKQSKLLLHCSNIYRVAAQEELAQKLCELSGMQRVFFCNSGAEANEAAIKLARLHAHNRGIHEPIIVVMESAFHGRTLATLAATGNTKAQAGFGPLPSGFLRIPYGDISMLRALRRKRNIAAVMLEPVQGEGGVRIPPPGYLQQIRDICTRKNWLMILDEIQSGMGRTGRWFAHQHEGISPDVMTLAKGLGGGVPIGACLARGAAAELFGPGSHGSTFGGNPLACRAAQAVVETIAGDELCARAAALGERIQTALREGLGGIAGVVEIRGKGLMIGIELDRPCGDLVKQALERFLLINVTAERVIRLLPPLILKDGEADQIAATVTELVKQFLAAPAETAS